MIIQNISSLSTTQGTTSDTAEVLGYYTPGDGGGGFFYWAATSSFAPNGGTVISANGTGVWIKILNGKVSVKEFGAKGDGVTDDTTSIQNAAKYVSEYNMQLFFPAAEYLIGASISFSGLTAKTDYSCSVSGDNATLIKMGNENTYFNMFFFTGANTDAKVSGITFDGRRDQINSCWNDNDIQFGVHSCIADKKTVGIKSSTINTINVECCYFINIHGRAFYDYLSKFVTVSNSYFRNIAENACVSESNGTMIVSNCHFENIGILPDSFTVGTTSYSFDGATGGTKWYHVYGDGIMSRNTFTKVSDCVFININRISVVNDIPDNGVKQDITCCNNSILYDHLRLRCSNPQGAIWLENGYSGMVTGNTIKYINRSPDDLQGYVICIAQSSVATEGRFVVDGNLIDTTLSNKTSMSAIIVANSANREVFINNNIAFGSFIFCLNFSFQLAAANFKRVSITNNYFDNTSTAANSSCINREALGGGTGTIEEFTLKGNFLKQGNLSDTRDPYLFGVEASYVKNYIEDNNFNNASISLSYSNNGAYIKGNIGVKFLRSLMDTANKLAVEIVGNEIDYIQMQNQFAVNIPSLTGHVLRNKLKNISIHAADDLIIGDNTITAENTNGININPLGKNVISNKLRIWRNSMIIPANSKGISINNSPSAQCTNSIISNNTIDGENNISTVGIAFTTTGNRNNVVLQDNTVVRVTTGYINPA